MFLADPERALAVSYAPLSARPALAALFALDERLGGIVGITGEPMIGLMRLAWWREALERLDHAPPPAEPLLRVLAAAVLPHGVSGAALAEIEDGWAALLDGEPDPAAIARHGRERGARLFVVAGGLLGTDGDRLAALGAGWALADLGHRHSSVAVRSEARAQARVALASVSGVYARVARPLAALGMLAARDARATDARRQASPARIARMLVMRLTGR